MVYDQRRQHQKKRSNQKSNKGNTMKKSFEDLNAKVSGGKIYGWYDEDGTQICPACMQIMDQQNVQMGGLHINCFESCIDVWRVTTGESDEGGFITREFDDIKAFVNDVEESMDIGDSYTIRREEICTGLYFHAPEFDGF